MAHKLELFELKDLINLTFCCQQATVITDFSDLSAVGRNHHMNLHGGSAKMEELDALDGEETARRLIESGSGTITPYGVVYDNGMKLEQVYDGQFFPCYYYEPNAITIAVTAKSEPEDTEHITWLYLPMAQEEVDRALQRAGIMNPADARLHLEDTQLPDEVDMMAWSDDPKAGFLTQKGIASIRSKMTNEIFRDEMTELYIRKDAAYKESIQTAKALLLERIRALETGAADDPGLAKELQELSQALAQVGGKHVYSYLPKSVKAQVDAIVERLAQLPEVAACYDQWWKLKDEIAGYYGRNTPPRQPLTQRKEFRSLKNWIIREAEDISFSPSADSTEPEEKQSTEKTPPIRGSVDVQSVGETVSARHIPANAVMRLLHHMGQIFRTSMPVIPPALRIDSKRRRRLQEKRIALGHKRDDHEDEQLHHVNDNTM